MILHHEVYALGLVILCDDLPTRSSALHSTDSTGRPPDPIQGGHRIVLEPAAAVTLPPGPPRRAAMLPWLARRLALASNQVRNGLDQPNAALEILPATADIPAVTSQAADVPAVTSQAVRGLCLHPALPQPGPARTVTGCVNPTYSANTPQTQVFVGDCRDVLAGLPQASIDLAFADPPFNQGEGYGVWDDQMPWERYEQFTADWLDALLRVLKPDGTLIINVPDAIAAEIVVFLKQRGMVQRRWCIWHYRFGQCIEGNFISSKVHVLYFVRDAKNYCWNSQDILVSSDRATKYDDPRTRATKTPGMRVPFDVWGVEGEKYWGRVQGNNKERRDGHPNQLPEVYLERVIRALSEPGDLVLDPFLGSGTTCTVARALDRRSIGIEINPQFAASAFERSQQGAVRVSLTAPTPGPELLEETPPLAPGGHDKGAPEL